MRFIFSDNVYIVKQCFRSLQDNFLKVFLFNGAGIDLISAPQTAATIVIIKDTLLPKEGYTLTISKKRITIKASDGGGAFYAIQSLRHILPPDVEQEHTSGVDTITIPCLEIKDAPMFTYRGMHLDVSRHYFPKEFIKLILFHHKNRQYLFGLFLSVFQRLFFCNSL